MKPLYTIAALLLVWPNSPAVADDQAPQDPYERAYSICETQVSNESENYAEEWEACMERNGAYANDSQETGDPGNQ